MALLVTYRCPDCGGDFDFLHHPRDEPPPSRCQLCNAYLGAEPERAPVLKLNMGTVKGRMAEHVYRQMEAGSIARAQAAADMAGCDVSEMSDLKITDMNDNLREGDVAAKTSANVTQAQKNLSYQVGGRTIGPELQSAQAAQWAGQTTSGDAALSTRQMIDAKQASGEMRGQLSQMTRAGQLAKVD